MQHSHAMYDRITEDEANFIAQAFEKEDSPTCPDCMEGYFLAGPEGGASVNCRCDNCGAEFNLTCFFGAVIGDRIVAKGERDSSRDWCYGNVYYGNERPKK